MNETEFAEPKVYNRQYGSDVHTFTYNPSPNGKENTEGYNLTITRPGGYQETYSGRSAKAMALDADGNYMFKMDPAERAVYKRGRNDFRNSAYYYIPFGLQKAIASDTPTMFGKTFNTPLTATAVGAGIGLAGAGLGTWLGHRTGMLSKGKGSWYPLLGMLLGGGIGFVSNRFNPLSKHKKTHLEKRSSTIQDPRNFVLNKLQRATDIPLSKKAILANKVRNMEIDDAEQLQKDVRAAAGIGVGNIIANKFNIDTKDNFIITKKLNNYYV